MFQAKFGPQTFWKSNLSTLPFPSRNLDWFFRRLSKTFLFRENCGYCGNGKFNCPFFTANWNLELVYQQSPLGRFTLVPCQRICSKTQGDQGIAIFKMASWSKHLNDGSRQSPLRWSCSHDLSCGWKGFIGCQERSSHYIMGCLQRTNPLGDMLVVGVRVEIGYGGSPSNKCHVDISS